MRNFIKNLSTFRLLVIFLFVIAASFYLYNKYAALKHANSDTEAYRVAYEALLECADVFNVHLTAQKSMAAALAMQVKLLPDVYDTEKLAGLLQHAMDSSPKETVGLGILRPEAGSEMRMLTFISRNPDDNQKEYSHKTQEYTESFNHTSSGEPLTWKLVLNSPSEMTSRFSSRLAIPIDGDKAGEVVVRSDLSWLVGVLRRLSEVSSEPPVCVTPQMEAIWLHNSRLVYDGDYLPDEEFPENGVIDRVLRFVKTFGGGGAVEFLHVDIQGTGWRLLIVDPRIAPNKRESVSAMIIFVIIAIVAFVLERVVSFLGQMIMGKIDSNLMFGSLMDTKVAVPKERGLGAIFYNVYQFLFQYRIVNPHQERVDSELRVARQIQFSLVPESFPAYSAWREFDIFSILSPAREVGGDYYDFFMLNPNRFVFCVGDVSGKGVPAALYMAVCRTAFRSLAHPNLNPSEFMGRFNDMLVRNNKSGFYITLTSFFIDLPSGRCDYILAGHPAPLLYRSVDGEVELVDSPRETFAGIKADIHFPMGSLTMQKGDTLLLYTDGISDARNSAGEELEYSGLCERFVKLIKHECCRDLILGLEKSVREYMNNNDQDDDITLLAFRYWGPGGQKLRQRPVGVSSRSPSGNNDNVEK